MPSPTTRPIRNFTRFLPGVTLAVIGSLLAIAGGGLLAAFGTDGKLASGPHLLSTPTGAIVSPVASIKDTSGVATVTGQPTLRLSASPVHGTAAVFTDLPYSITGIRHSGLPNATPPTAQRFWVAQATSTRRAAEINWKIHDGQYRVVVMSANGHGGFASTTAIGITIPNITIYAIAGLLLGLLIAGGGTALLIRTTRQPQATANASSPTADAAAVPTP